MIDYLLITGIYALYLEINPDMGNIWIRGDYLSPRGLINVIIYPLKYLRMWYPDMWDIICFIWILAYYGFKSSLPYIVKNLLE